MNSKHVRNLLIIDDEKDLLESLKLFLESSGFSVTTCLTVDQATNALKHKDFDLVITDIEMPIQTGLDFIEVQFEVYGLTTPVIVMSGKANMGYLTEALRLGVSDFVTKPIQPNLLLDIIRSRIKKNKRKNLDFDLENSQMTFNKSFVFYPSDYIYNSIVGYLFAEIQKNIKLNPYKKNEVYLVLEEAISNAFLHGIWQLTPEERLSDRETLEKVLQKKEEEAKNKKKRGVFVEFNFSRVTEKMTILVKDTGEGFNYDQFLSQIDSAMESRKLSGRGIFLIHTLSEKLIYHDGGSKIEIIIDVSNKNEKT